MAEHWDGVVRWVREVPALTRLYAIGAVCVTAGCAAGLIPPRALLGWSWSQPWRGLGGLLYLGPPGLGPVLELGFWLRFGGGLEKEQFGGRRADYLMLLGCGAGGLLVASWLGGRAGGLGSALVCVVVYVWSYCNPTVRINWFGLVLWAPYFPWLLLAASVMLGNSPVDELLGIAVGHLCFFLAFVLPRIRGVAPLRAPAALARAVDSVM